METVGTGAGVETQAGDSQEEHPDECHYPACLAQNNRFYWRSEVMLSNSEGNVYFYTLSAVTIH